MAWTSRCSAHPRPLRSINYRGRHSHRIRQTWRSPQSRPATPGSTWGLCCHSLGSDLTPEQAGGSSYPVPHFPRSFSSQPTPKPPPPTPVLAPHPPGRSWSGLHSCRPRCRWLRERLGEGAMGSSPAHARCESREPWGLAALLINSSYYVALLALLGDPPCPPFPGGL